MNDLLVLLKGLDSVVAVALLLVIFWQFRLFRVLSKQLNQNTRAVARMVALLEMLAGRAGVGFGLNSRETKQP